MAHDEYIPLRRTGSLRTGREADRGKLYHAVPHNGWRALCGKEPGLRADWATYPGDAVTCRRCLNLMAAKAADANKVSPPRD